MRSQAIFHRSKFLLKASPAPVFPSSRLLRSSRDDRSSRISPRISVRRLVTPATGPPSESPDASEDVVGTSSGAEPPSEGPEKPKPRRTRVVMTPAKDPEPIQLPAELDILWTPEEGTLESTHASALPLPQIFDEALNNLLITMHPQTQHRATYASPLGPPIEPTLGLYCPIEGGEYIVDATVRELARRTGSEVLVIDAVQLAAGEWGHFGAAANSLSLPRNPLHFPSSPQTSTSTNTRALAADEQDEPDTPPQSFMQPQQMTLTLMTPPALQGRILTSSSRRNPPPSKIKVFFDTLVNTPSKKDPSTTPLQSPKSRPRLVYIRDFPTLAPSSSTWYPPLLSAVRERRRGPITRPTSPISNPMTIIFGMTPPLTPPVPPNSPNSGLVSLLMSRSTPNQVSNEPKTNKPDWGEDESAEKTREKWLRDRLKKWEKGDSALYDEFHKLSTSLEGETNDEKPDFIVIGGANGMSGFPPMIGAGVPVLSNGRSDSENHSSFFRASILVPNVRSVNEERATRITRRREINELTMRMGVGTAGGSLDREAATSIHTEYSSTEENVGNGENASQGNQSLMWKDWGNRVEVWSNVRQIADRALGNTLSSGTISGNLEKATLDSTAISWSAIHAAWAAHNTSNEHRKSWLKDTSSFSRVIREYNEEDKTSEGESQQKTDEVIERVKNESDLDSHEQRLLSCIVDSASMPTSFNQVHLPPHTIDSVRTIVSLPLIHPQAFQQGILKEHGMTGCLLFGPPGTGKTLVVRALAKEAGCRMMTISPSDVMDMYVGEGEKLVRAVFSLARRLSPCVVFLDEIDALFGARMSARESGGAFAHRGVITEFMQEMDGLKSSNEDSVIVIGATNRPFDLDDAVLRRLPRRLLVDLPGQKEREEILKILLRDESLAEDLDIRDLATKTESFSGSDLKHLCVSAALDAVKENVLLPWTHLPIPQPSPDVTSSTQNISPSVPEDISVPDTTSTLSTEASLPGPIPTPTTNTPVLAARVLRLHNFTKALKEITPSSSEALGSLAELRKWNDEFGEGRRDRRRQQVWGKGRFGFTDESNQGSEDGKVLRSLSDPPSNVE